MFVFVSLQPTICHGETPQDVDKPACIAARHAIEQSGVLIFDRISPGGSSVFYKDTGDVGSVLSCITDPSLSLNLDDWKRKDPRATVPPQRLFDLLASQGELTTGAPARQIKTMAARCMNDAFADHDYSLGDIHEGSLEVDCEIFRDRGGGAIFSVTRRSDD